MTRRAVTPWERALHTEGGARRRAAWALLATTALEEERPQRAEWPLPPAPRANRRAAELARALRGEGPARLWSDEQLAFELESAGLRLQGRDGAQVLVQRGAVHPAIRWTAPRLLQQLRLIAEAERLLRRERSPKAWLVAARARGAQAAPWATSRTQLRAELDLLEPLVPGVRGCLRRVLCEVLAGGDALQEPVCVGLDPRRTGHAWFADSQPWQRAWAVQFRL